jgi:hypothetical protein
VLVLVGVRVTAESVVVVVVAAGSFTTVVQDVRRRPKAGIARSNRDSFFISMLMLLNPIRCNFHARMDMNQTFSDRRDDDFAAKAA